MMMPISEGPRVRITAVGQEDAGDKMSPSANDAACQEGH